jgi:hypothetical protein
MVQVPHRMVYSMETVGDKPSLRFEVMIANANTMYPIDETPALTPWCKVCQVDGGNSSRTLASGSRDPNARAAAVRIEVRDGGVNLREA